MIIGRNRFNIYLLLLTAVVLPLGCKTQSEKKEKATLRVHLEVSPESNFSTNVPIYRKKPVPVTVDKAPFLTEANVAEAKVVDVPGGYDLQIKFDRTGTWLFEEYTTTNPGKHLAIFCAFQLGKKKEARWLGAPIITRRVSDGILQFAPDATREEVEQIARGLTNVGKHNSEESKW